MSSFIKQCHQQLNVLLSILTENCVKIRRRKRSRRINWKHPTFAIASIVALILLALYHLGGFQGSELAAFDVLMQQQEDRGIDPRLLVVEITEADINQYRWPLSDEVLAQLLAKLQQAQPRAIGLDLYRHSPQGSGQGELLQKLRAENTIAVFKMGMDQTEGKPLPLAVTPERLGFGDIFLDGDGVVRRNGLFVTCDEGNRLYSFPLRLALTYLAKLGLSPQLSPKHPHRLQLGKVRLNPLSSHSGGYTQIDVRGSQILLDYRSPQTVARRVTVEQVLSGKVQSSWIKDKIAIVGLTDPSFKENRFDTPYSAAKSNPAQMPAVLLHAQMTSQLLDVALGQRSLFWFFPYLVEVFWLWGWSFVGSTLAWQLQPPKSLALALGGALLGLAAMVKGLFAFRVWVPLMGPGIGLGVAAMGVLCYRALDRAIHDSLTGLPNRTLFAKHLEFVLKRARSTPKEQCGAIFLDIDRFKAINGSLGHWAGDRLLREVAQRIDNVCGLAIW